MKVAFYAPLKPPDHVNPSGDRLIARLLLAAIRGGGHHVEVASSLRSFEGAGDQRRQQQIRDQALNIAEQLIQSRDPSTRPDAWFSYHVYHKAPDWIGPVVCDALNIPYLIAEASISPRQAEGTWAQGHQQAIHCVARADALISLNRRDLKCTRPFLSSRARILELAPFIDLDDWPPAVTPRASIPLRLVTVARMRAGDKTRSWHLVCDLLERLPESTWTLDAVGDGASRDDIENRLRAIGGDRIRCHGRLEGKQLAALLDRCDLLLWPAVNEAFGMVLLEVQSRGLAVFAGRNGGVPDVIRHGCSGFLFDLERIDKASQSLAYLIERPRVIERMGRNGMELVRSRHQMGVATNMLNQLLEELCGNSS